MQRTFQITVGDPFHDGHGLTESCRVLLQGQDLSDDALQEAYRRAVSLTGLDLSKDLFAGYEDCVVPPEATAALLAQGLSFEEEEGLPSPQVCSTVLQTPAGQDIEVDAAFLLLLFLRLGMPSLTWEVLEAPQELIGVGGVLGRVAPTYGYGLLFA